MIRTILCVAVLWLPLTLMLSCRGKERPVADPATKKLEMILLAEDSIRLLEQRSSALDMEIAQYKNMLSRSGDSSGSESNALRNHLRKLQKEKDKCILRKGKLTQTVDKLRLDTN